MFNIKIMFNIRIMFNIKFHLVSDDNFDDDFEAVNKR